MEQIQENTEARAATEPWAEQHPVFTGLVTLLTFHAMVMLGILRGITTLKPAAEPFLIGVVQLVYVVPVGMVFFAVGYRKTLKVFVRGALATFVLNLATCAAFLYLLGSASW